MWGKILLQLHLLNNLWLFLNGSFPWLLLNVLCFFPKTTSKSFPSWGLAYSFLSFHISYHVGVFWMVGWETKLMCSFIKKKRCWWLVPISLDKNKNYNQYAKKANAYQALAWLMSWCLCSSLSLHITKTEVLSSSLNQMPQALALGLWHFWESCCARWTAGCSTVPFIYFLWKTGKGVLFGFMCKGSQNPSENLLWDPLFYLVFDSFGSLVLFWDKVPGSSDDT